MVTAAEIQAAGGYDKWHARAMRQANAEPPARTRPSLARRAPHEAGRMNKTEAAYFAHLQARPDVLAVVYEGCKLKLAEATFYTPDFVVVTRDGIELHEVKGFWEDDARVKWKATAEKFWWFRFVAVQKRKGGWKIEEYGKGDA